MRITGLDETIAINVIKICCAINYQTFDNFLFLFLFLFSFLGHLGLFWFFFFFCVSRFSFSTREIRWLE